MRFTTKAVLFCLFFPPACAFAQEKGPITAHHKMVYGVVKNILIKSAEKMPEESYAFKPADTVRTYGQIVGHVADTQYWFCSAALGVKNASLDIEKTKTTKAELIAALKESFAYCDKAYDAMTDVAGVELVKAFGQNMPKLGVLSTNNLHAMEHYGNLVTYMRMKGLVPPTSEPGFLQQEASK